MKFYVYVYQDPCVPGNFTYGDHTFEYEPFYVGKGMGKRWMQHLRCTDKINLCKNSRVASVLEMGVEPAVSFVFRTNSEEEAYAKEAEFISLIGRGVSGPLVNLTGGGSGCSSGEGHPWFGRKHSEETVARFSYLARHRTPEHQGKISKAKTGIPHTDEAKAKISIATAGEKNPFFGKTHTEATKAKMRGRVMPEEQKEYLRSLYVGKPLEGEHKIKQKENSLRGEASPHFGKHKPDEEKVRQSAKKVKFRWVLTFDGIDYVVYSLNLFCEQHNLDSSAMLRAYRKGTSHKGCVATSREELPERWYEDSSLYAEYVRLAADSYEQLKQAA